MHAPPFSRPDQPAYFDAMFAKSNDPWKFRSRWYERRKRALTLACLPSARYAHGFEPGCANGELSACLATRCDRLLVSDGVILACHWRHPIEGCVLDGDDVHDASRHFIRLPNQCHVQEPDLQLDVWSSGPTMAQKEDIS